MKNKKIVTLWFYDDELDLIQRIVKSKKTSQTRYLKRIIMKELKNEENV